MINPENGSILFADGRSLGPSLSLDEFVWVSPFYKEAQRGAGVKPWTSWVLAPADLTAGRFVITLYFHESELARASLVLAGESLGPWSRETELARKEKHEALLRQALGHAPPYTYPWGEVTFVLDERAGASTIEVVYRTL